MPRDVLAAASFSQGDQGGKDGENTYSTPNKDWPVLQEFKQGQSMEIKAVMKAWHYVRICVIPHEILWQKGNEPRIVWCFYISFMCKRKELEKTAHLHACRRVLDTSCQPIVTKGRGRKPR